MPPPLPTAIISPYKFSLCCYFTLFQAQLFLESPTPLFPPPIERWHDLWEIPKHKLQNCGLTDFDRRLLPNSPLNNSLSNSPAFESKEKK